MSLSTRSLMRIAVLTPLLNGSLATAGVLVVAPSGGQYAQIQPAVDAASPGDVILVRSGTHSPVTVVAKSLTISADTGAVVTIAGTTTVRDLAAGQVVVLSGLRGTGVTSNSTSDDAGLGLLLRANAGLVRIQGCEFTGARGWGDGGSGGAFCCDLPLHDNGWDAARIDACPAGTTFTATTLRGGRGAYANTNCYCGTGDTGGDGLRVSASMVALYDCTLVGGRGGDNGGSGGPAGMGLRTLASGGALASACVLTGGRGGDGYDYIYSEGGAGGNGAQVGAGTALQHIGCTFQAGVGGQACFGLFPPGPNGSPTGGAGQIFLFSAPSVTLASPLIARENTSLPLTIGGAPGGLAVLRIARMPGFQPVPSLRGVLLVQQPLPARMLILGTIPAGGTLLANLAVQDLGAGVASATYYLQALVMDAATGTTLGTGAALTVLDSLY